MDRAVEFKLKAIKQEFSIRQVSGDYQRLVYIINDY